MREIEAADVDDADEHWRHAAGDGRSSSRVGRRRLGRAARRLRDAPRRDHGVRQRQGLPRLDGDDVACGAAAVHDLGHFFGSQLHRDEVAAPDRVSRQLSNLPVRTGQPHETAHFRFVGGRLTGRRRRHCFSLRLGRRAHRLLKHLPRPVLHRHGRAGFNGAGELGSQRVHFCVSVADDAEARVEPLEIFLLDHYALRGSGGMVGHNGRLRRVRVEVDRVANDTTSADECR